VAQIGQPGDTTPLNHWDVGSVDGGVLLTVSNSLMNSLPGAPNQQYINGGGGPPPCDPCASTNYPNFAGQYDTKISVVQMRTYFRFRPAAIISVDLPDNALGNYHLNAGSPAIGIGKNPPDAGPPVTDDIDGRTRPPTTTDAGAHQYVPGGQ
jgi:hypothetical protein